MMPSGKAIVKLWNHIPRERFPLLVTAESGPGHGSGMAEARFVKFY